MTLRAANPVPRTAIVLSILWLSPWLNPLWSQSSDFIRGDAGGDGIVDVDDATLITEFLFSGATINCDDAADANDDGVISNQDAIFVLAFVTTGGPPPPSPGPRGCGPDPTADALGCNSYSCPFIRGDADGNGFVDTNDATAISNFLFAGGPMPCLDAGDANDDGVVTNQDSIYLLAFLTTGGPPPPPPGEPVIGVDFTSDNLDCQSYNAPVIFVRGDADGNAVVDSNDATAITNFLFMGGTLACRDAADANDDGAITNQDAIYILAFVSTGGPPPPAPGPFVCGTDQTADALDCLNYSCTFHRGDADGDNDLTAADATAITNFLFMGGTLGCLDAADANDDGVITNQDALFVLNSLICGAAPPLPTPFVCGVDLTPDNLDCQTYVCQPTEDFMRGDCNADALFNIADAIFLLSFLFPMGMPPQPTCRDACDGNDDGCLDIGDPVSILGALFGGAGVLPAPFMTCGYDPTPQDRMGCLNYDGCP